MDQAQGRQKSAGFCRVMEDLHQARLTTCFLALAQLCQRIASECADEQKAEQFEQLAAECTEAAESQSGELKPLRDHEGKTR
jgi:hypothetical protein